MSNHLKNLFLFMKEHGYWKQYATYEDYKKKELHINEEVPEERDIKKELNLNEEESAQFDKMFATP